MPKFRHKVVVACVTVFTAVHGAGCTFAVSPIRSQRGGAADAVNSGAVRHEYNAYEADLFTGRPGLRSGIDPELQRYPAPGPGDVCSTHAALCIDVRY